DEASWNAGRYRSICLVTGERHRAIALHGELLDCLEESNVSEFKWKKLSSAKHRYAAVKMIDLATDACCSNKMRIDVVIWDTHDVRHNVFGRDDTANLFRM